MAISVTLKEDGSLQNLAYRVAEVIFDSSYPTGGETVTPASLGLSSIVAVLPVDSKIPVGWDPANNKLIAYYPGVDSDVAATLTTSLTGTNNDIVWTAQPTGKLAGNRICIEYRDPGAINAALSVSVSGYRITVNLATNGSGVITTTSTALRTAVNADPSAGALVQGANSGGDTGAGTVTAMALSYLTGGKSNYGYYQNNNSETYLEGLGATLLFIGAK